MMGEDEIKDMAVEVNALRKELYGAIQSNPKLPLYRVIKNGILHMKKSIRELLRDNLIWICLLGIALLFVGQFISSLIDPFPLPNYFNNNFKRFFDGFVLNGFCALVAILHG